MSSVSIKVQQFLRKYIQTVWQLELLLCLSSSQEPKKSDELSKALYLNDDVVSRSLVQFERSGLVRATEEGYYFAPTSSALRSDAEEAMKTYQSRRVAVINFIYSEPIQTFSDAFKFRQED